MVVFSLLVPLMILAGWPKSETEARSTDR